MKKFSKMKMWKKVLIVSLVLAILSGVIKGIMNSSSVIETESSISNMDYEDLNIKMFSTQTDTESSNFKDFDYGTLSPQADTHSTNNTGSIIVILIQVISTIVASITIYLVPTFVANDRKHKNKLAIILIDIFLGWSLIRLGWCFGMGLYYTK